MWRFHLQMNQERRRGGCLHYVYGVRAGIWYGDSGDEGWGV